MVVFKILGFFKLVSDREVFIKSHGIFVGGDGLSELEELDHSKAFSAVGFGEVALDVDTGVAVVDTLMEQVEVVVADGAVGVKAVIVGFGFYRLTVVFNCLLVVFVLERLIALFFPLFGRFLDVHFYFFKL